VAGDQQPEAIGGADRPTLTVETLTRWEENGATWRTIEVSDERAVVELCTCYGEPVDMLQGEAPELIEFVRSHRGAD
jgi:hypothetical protein